MWRKRKQWRRIGNESRKRLKYSVKEDSWENSQRLWYLSKHLKGKRCKSRDYLEKKVSGREKDKYKCPEPGAYLRSPVKNKAASWWGWGRGSGRVVWGEVREGTQARWCGASSALNGMRTEWRVLSWRLTRANIPFKGITIVTVLRINGRKQVWKKETT